MAGSRANLAVTKDGETYNKLQRPDNFLEKSAVLTQANERKRERAAVDGPIAGPASGNKRAKTHHTDSTVNILQSSSDKHQHRSAGPVSECGMRMTLPIDEDQHSDDSLGEALAYLRSVRSEASAIPHLLVASRTHDENANSKFLQTPTASTRQRAFYQDGAWISVEEGYEATYNDDYEHDDSDPQELYHKQLIKRFETLRSTLSGYGARRLADNPDVKANESLSVKPPSNRHEWLYILDREYPTRTQISQLNENNIRRGLEYCVYAMDRFDTISSQKSCWIWALLALSSDVGTLDSQKMSHIRDLGNKAGELSANLHSDLKRQNRGAEDDLLRTDPAAGGQDDEAEADETTFCDASEDDHSSETGYVHSGVNEHLDSTSEITLNKSRSGTRNDVQHQAISLGTSDIPTSLDGSTNTDTNDDILERARARLLAQLGDNLVQAGIPASALNTDETRPHHSEQLDQGSDDPSHKITIRTIPARAEAERQRQMMRTQDSAMASLRGADPPHSKPSAAIHSVVEDHSSCLVDLNTRVTIDMILTVVAECYGQRDLLRFRKPW
ncbi:hypothetical protein BU25DRAFT_412188 [Macroventuria anomochaeta]|uniref:Uncharacterized protein n=1 Tax=Macroventuria anomochaeta TaxID=301207 RepID=A0ACB6RXS2_9PLEO|nr:uncharacterized protein BU25DRAFT_412188 [Macroventuria anomochaeta]KAF2625943.1 hypothetical protein BU25DRAFT_412188 [Macroventuria anomochaeta]